jgi:hypothetical protein
MPKNLPKKILGEFLTIRFRLLNFGINGLALTNLEIFS